MTNWNWFHGNATNETNQVSNQPKIDYDAIAKVKTSSIEAITKDPSILKRVIDNRQSYRRCFDDDDDGDGQYFIDRLVKYKTLQESDFESIDNLDWEWLAARVPLSNAAITRHLLDKPSVWAMISRSQLYIKDIEFIRTFQDNLNPFWQNTVFSLKRDDLLKLVFQERILPLDICFSRSLISCKDLEEHATENLEVDAHTFQEHCYNEQYAPQKDKFIELFKQTKPHWSQFIITCNPDETFIETHIICDQANTTNATWDTLSGQVYSRDSRPFVPSPAFYTKYKDKLVFKHLLAANFQFDPHTLQENLTWDNSTLISKSQQLDEEFIDANEAILDWYELTRSHQMSDEFLRCHIKQLCWKHVKLHQKGLTPEFIKEFSTHL